MGYLHTLDFNTIWNQYLPKLSQNPEFYVAETFNLKYLFKFPPKKQDFAQISNPFLVIQ